MTDPTELKQLTNKQLIETALNYCKKLPISTERPHLRILSDETSTTVSKHQDGAVSIYRNHRVALGLDWRRKNAIDQRVVNRSLLIDALVDIEKHLVLELLIPEIDK